MHDIVQCFASRKLCYEELIEQHVKAVVPRKVPLYPKVHFLAEITRDIQLIQYTVQSCEPDHSLPQHWMYYITSTLPRPPCW